MIGYATLGTNEIETAAAFYDALLGEMGVGRMMELDNMVGWGTGFERPMVAVIKPYDGQAATVGNGTMIALQLEKPEQVDALHAKALELGAADEGAPGPRGPGFYCGYFRDLDGNKLNFFCMGGG